MKTDILGVRFDDMTVPQAVEAGVGLLGSGGFHYVVTPNPELVMAAEGDETYRAALNGGDLVLPDGIGVVYAAKILGRPLQARCPGIDFATGLMEKIARTGEKLFLLGAKPGVAQMAAENLKAQFPGLQICGTHDGYFTQDGPVVLEIRQAAADVVFVCLGAPKQEFWMVQNGPECGAKLMAGLGGVLDVFAGTVERAPEKWQKMGLEWCYRLLKQPSRIGRMAKLPWFLVKALGARISGR